MKLPTSYKEREIGATWQSRSMRVYVSNWMLCAHLGTFSWNISQSMVMDLLQWTAVTDLQTLIRLCLDVTSNFIRQHIDGSDNGLLSRIQAELHNLSGSTASKSGLLPNAVVASVNGLMRRILSLVDCPSSPSSIRDLLAATVYTLIIALEFHVRAQVRLFSPGTELTAALATSAGPASCSTWIAALDLIRVDHLIPGSALADFIHLTVVSFSSLVRLAAWTPPLLDRLRTSTRQVFCPSC